MRFHAQTTPPARRSIERDAARWFARRDRGLTPPEQDAYLDWLTACRAHAIAIARVERIWERLGAVRDFAAPLPSMDRASSSRTSATWTATLWWLASALLFAGAGFVLAAAL